jgi:NADH:ubiquinone oxidoreductase subunit E
MNESELTETIEKFRNDPAALVAILQDIQEKYNYLPKDVLTKLSKELNLPLSRILSVATFYTAFSLTPKGKYPINVCVGAACHIRGGSRIAEKIERELKIKRGETTEDLNFSLDEVRCLGCCGLAPVMKVKRDIHGKLSESNISSILEQYKK